MIIANGTIEIKRKSGGGIDTATGLPLPVLEEWGVPVECQYYHNRMDLLARTRAGESYSDIGWIIIVEQPWSMGDSEEIRLRDHAGQVVGTYALRLAEPLDAVQQVRLVVG